MNTYLVDLGLFKLDPNVPDPLKATQWSACVDLHASFYTDVIVKNQHNKTSSYNMKDIGGVLMIYPGERALVPTGLILDIPEAFSVRLHPRSGTAWKSGITLANAEGVIDSDYVDPLFVLLHNTTQEIFSIKEYERIAQMEVVPRYVPNFYECENRPEKKTDRDGGLGHSGT